VAFADFMTSMFALFLVLWLVNQSSDIKAAVAGYFQDPLGRAEEFGSSILPGEGAQASTVRPLDTPQVMEMRRDRLMMLAERLKKRLAQLPDLADVRQFVEIELTDDGLRIQLLEDSTGVFFETGRSAPSARGQEILSMLGAELGQLPNMVRIEGHTDARPYSGESAYTNWELSADRANTARRILTAHGLPAQQMSQIRGMADRDLRDPADPFAARNRRVTLTMLFNESGERSGAHPDLTEPAGSDTT
jgi:chemotaxis protein MotB